MSWLGRLLGTERKAKAVAGGGELSEEMRGLRHRLEDIETGEKRALKRVKERRRKQRAARKVRRAVKRRRGW